MRAGWLLVLLWAVLAARMASAGNEDDFAVRLDRAEEALHAGRLDEAGGLYRRLVDLYPYRTRPYRDLARILAERGRNDEAVDLLLKVGRQLLAAARNAEAIPALELARDLAPGRAEPQALLGKALAEERRYVDAADALERAMELGDRTLLTLLARAAACWEAECYDDPRASTGAP